MESASLGNLNVDSNGSVSVSGVSSGIDFRATIDAIIEARRIPVVTIENRITENEEKILAYQDLDTSLATLQSSVDGLRGAVSLGGIGDTFQNKQTFTSASRTDGQTPSVPGNLISASLDNSADAGVHEIEIRRVATAHKISSQSFASLTAALSLSGTFDIQFDPGSGPTTKTITIDASDKLVDVRDKINNANIGTDATGVTASIVSVSDTEHYLVLTNDDTGADIDLINETGSILTAASGLGISEDGGTTFDNVLQQAQTARFTADGLKDPDRFESSVLTSSTAVLNTVITPSNATGSFDIDSTTVNYDTAVDSLSDLATRITSTVANVTATVVSDGDGFRLDITSTNPTIDIVDTSGLLGDLNVNNDLVIERTSNTVSDLFEGVTLTLFQAEPATTLKIEIEQDLSALKAQIQNVVNAYNDVRGLINANSLTDATTGEKSEDAGILFGERTLSEVRGGLGELISASVAGVDSAFATLAQIGISIANSSVTDPLLAGTLVIDESKLDDALLNNPDDVRRLLAFDFSISEPNVSLLDFTGASTFSASGYTLNIGDILYSSESDIVTDNTVPLDTVTTATGSGSFDVNGTGVAYDTTTDSLDDLAANITAGVPGVTATVITTSFGFELRLESNNATITVDNDSGNLLSALNIAAEPDVITQANIDGLADGTDNSTITISGRTITVTDQNGAEGLLLFYDGVGPSSGIQVDFTTGFASESFFFLDVLTDESEGAIQGEIASLEGSNILAQERIDAIEARIEIERQLLIDKFARAEAALATANRVLDTITQQFAALTADR